MVNYLFKDSNNIKIWSIYPSSYHFWLLLYFHFISLFFWRILFIRQYFSSPFMSEKFYILPLFLKNIIAWCRILGIFFLTRNWCSLYLCSIQCIVTFFLLAAFKILSLVLSNLIIMCLGAIFFIFLVLRVHWASWICGFIIFLSMGSFHPLFQFSFCSPYPHPPLFLWGL